MAATRIHHLILKMYHYQVIRAIFLKQIPDESVFYVFSETFLPARNKAQFFTFRPCGAVFRRGFFPKIKTIQYGPIYEALIVNIILPVSAPALLSFCVLLSKDPERGGSLLNAVSNHVIVLPPCQAVG